MTEPIVKRVIAVEGQHVTVDYGAGTVSVDGQVLDEPYINELMVDTLNPYMTVLDVTVPEGSIDVMGDDPEPLLGQPGPAARHSGQTVCSGPRSVRGAPLPELRSGRLTALKRKKARQLSLPGFPFPVFRSTSSRLRRRGRHLR